MEKEWRTWPLRGGKAGGQKEGEERKGGGNEEKRKRGKESWNRAAEWLRPALQHATQRKCYTESFIYSICLSEMLNSVSNVYID